EAIAGAVPGAALAHPAAGTRPALARGRSDVAVPARDDDVPIGAGRHCHVEVVGSPSPAPAARLPAATRLSPLGALAPAPAHHAAGLGLALTAAVAKRVTRVQGSAVETAVGT